jgi:hypothetical protein
MFVPDVALHVGRFCEVATRNGMLYGELVRLSSVVFLVRPKLPAALPGSAVSADDIIRVTPLPDPRR